MEEGKKEYHKFHSQLKLHNKYIFFIRMYF